MKRDEILKLDRWWVAHVYFRPRDKHGNLITKPERTLSPKQAFFAHWKRFDLAQWQIERLWNAEREQKKREAVQAKAKPEGSKR